MLITKLEPIEKSKVKVYIDYEYEFILYQKDIYNFRIEENGELSELQYNDILQNTVLRRGKQKALAILKHMDRTESELSFKLKQSGYKDELVEVIMDYIKGYGYVDDSRYANYYVRNMKDSKSKTQIIMVLKQKGVSKEDIEHAFYEEYPDDGEEEAIKKAINKKVKNMEIITTEEKTKLRNYLYRKGFSYELITKFIN